MDFFFNSFMTVLGGLTALAVVFFVWNVGPLVIVAILPKIISKKKQAQFMVDLKKNPWRNAEVLRVARKWGWHEEE
jgi:hypothetical protein